MRTWCGSYANLVALAIVGYPVVAAAMLALGNHTSLGSIAFRAVELGLAGLLLVMSIVLRLAWPLRPMLLFGALWAALMLRLVWDASVVAIPLDLPWLEHALMTVGGVLVPATAAACIFDTRALDKAARLIQVWGAVAGLLVGVSVFVAVEEWLSSGRIGTTTLNPISVGHLGASLVLVSVVASARGVPALSIFDRIADARSVRWACAAIGLVLVTAAASRGPVIALTLVCIGFVFVRELARRGILGLLRALSLLSVTVAVGAVGLVLLLEDVHSVPLLARLLSVASDASSSMRQELIAGALQQFEANPILGSSFVELEQRFYPHNIVVEALMTTGVVGFGLLLALLVLAAAASIRLMLTRFAWLPLLFGQYVVGSMISGALYFDLQLWVLMNAVFAADLVLRSTPIRAGAPAAPRARRSARVAVRSLFDGVRT